MTCGESREFLSDLLGRRVTLLAYPRGLHDPDVRKAAEAAGYTHAFALPETAEEPGDFAVPRVGIYRGNGLLALRVKAARPYLQVRTSKSVERNARRVKRVRQRSAREGLSGSVGLRRGEAGAAGATSALAPRAVGAGACGDSTRRPGRSSPGRRGTGSGSRPPCG